MHRPTGESDRAGSAESGAGAALSFPWDDLRVFLAVFRAGSLTAAARALQANQSTVSRRLTAFEEAIGKVLFDRLPEGTRPTALAEALLPAAERAEQATLDLAQVIAGHEAAVVGEVRLASVPDLLRTFVAPRLPSLLSRHPALRLALLGSSTLVDLNRREADLAIRFVRPTQGDLISRPLGSMPFRALCAPSYLQGRPPPATWDDLDWITFDDSLAFLPEMMWLKQNVRVPPRVVSNDFGTQRAAAEAGLGVFLGAGPPSTALVPVTPAQTGPGPPAVQAWLVGHQALRHVPRVKAVWDWIVEESGAAFGGS
jgi:DNA-binding transcriptional LysR family regulator